MASSVLIKAHVSDYVEILAAENAWNYWYGSFCGQIADIS